MKFEQALKAMREGKKVWHKGFDQSKCWKENSYLAIVNGRISFFEEGKPSVNYPDFHFNIFESPFILGNDWEIYDDTPTDEALYENIKRAQKIIADSLGINYNSCEKPQTATAIYFLRAENDILEPKFASVKRKIEALEKEISEKTAENNELRGQMKAYKDILQTFYGGD